MIIYGLFSLEKKKELRKEKAQTFLVQEISTVGHGIENKHPE